MFGFVITFFSYFRISQLTLFKYFLLMLIAILCILSNSGGRLKMNKKRDKNVIKCAKSYKAIHDSIH